MSRPLTSCLLLCALLCRLTATPGHAQGADGAIAHARQTLTDMIRLIDAIQARQASPGEAATGAAVAAPSMGDWKPLFDGASLAGWKRSDFIGGGKAHVEPHFRGGPAALVVDAGSSLSGITWTKDVPRTNFEISLEAMKIEGNDFMCGLTFPVGDAEASLIVGGWGGTVVGISSINDRDASENETTKFITFPKDRWYAIRMRVTPDRLEAWLDEKRIINADIKGRKISLRYGEIVKSVPLGLATYQTTAAYRNIKIRHMAAQ